jgi:hypothetical protein
VLRYQPSTIRTRVQCNADTMALSAGLQLPHFSFQFGGARALGGGDDLAPELDRDGRRVAVHAGQQGACPIRNTFALRAEEPLSGGSGNR